MKELLNTLQQEYPEIIADIRGSGLFVGAEISDTNGNPNTQLAVDIKNRLREVFILIGTDGPHDNVLKIKPPLSFTLQDSEILVAEIHLILKDLLGLPLTACNLAKSSLTLLSNFFILVLFV